MDAVHIEHLIREQIADVLNVDVESVTDGAGLIDDLGADSLDVIELLMACEDEFDIVIADDEAEAALTVGDAIKLVHRKLAPA